MTKAKMRLKHNRKPLVLGQQCKFHQMLGFVLTGEMKAKGFLLLLYSIPLRTLLHPPLKQHALFFSQV